MSYSIFNPYPDYTALTWSEVFSDGDEFAWKVQSVGGDSSRLDELYTILANKYAASTTRYMMEEAFVLALRRELDLAWSIYLKQKDIMDEVYNLSTSELMKQLETIRESSRETESDARNVGSTTDTGSSTTNGSGSDTGLQNEVNANNSPVTNASTVPIANKSNRQVSNRGSNTNTSTSTANQNGSNTLDTESKVNDEYIEQVSQLGNKLEALNKQYEIVSRDYLNQIYRKTDGLFKVIAA